MARWAPTSCEAAGPATPPACRTACLASSTARRPVRPASARARSRLVAASSSWPLHSWVEAAWADARAGRRRIVLVAGETGTGKTRLATELAALAERDAAAVLAGRCDQYLGVA
jgi:transcriptional regulator with AAA-type ATPase domain